jgi:hypothetical protein
VDKREAGSDEERIPQEEIKKCKVIFKPEKASIDLPEKMNT